MNKSQEIRFRDSWKKFHGENGGKMAVDNAPVEDSDRALMLLSCLDDSDMEALLEDMAAACLIMESLENPLTYKPSHIPHRGSKATLYVTCSDGRVGARWSK